MQPCHRAKSCDTFSRSSYSPKQPRESTSTASTDEGNFQLIVDLPDATTFIVVESGDTPATLVKKVLQKWQVQSEHVSLSSILGNDGNIAVKATAFIVNAVLSCTLNVKATGLARDIFGFKSNRIQIESAANPRRWWAGQVGRIVAELCGSSFEVHAKRTVLISGSRADALQAYVLTLAAAIKMPTTHVQLRIAGKTLISPHLDSTPSSLGFGCRASAICNFAEYTLAVTNMAGDGKSIVVKSDMRLADVVQKVSDAYSIPVAELLLCRHERVFHDSDSCALLTDLGLASDGVILSCLRRKRSREIMSRAAKPN